MARSIAHESGSEPEVIGDLRRLAGDLQRAPWFAACGEPLTASEREEARTYLAALDFTGIEIAGVADWRRAALLTQDPLWSREWWEREAAAQAALQLRAAARLGERRALRALTEITEAAEILHGEAALAMSRAGIADPALSRVAAGAAAQACHQAGLARAAGGGDAHFFAAKFRVFAGGRWPLGIVGGCYFVF